MEFIKKFFSKKVNIVLFILIIIIIAIMLCIVFSFDENRSFSLNKIYDVYPDEVKNLYANMVDVSCTGDLNFNITKEDGKVMASELGPEVLLGYVFSYLDKKDRLKDSFDVEVIEDTAKILFTDIEIDLIDYIDDYQYGDYIYNVKKKKVTRKSKECVRTDRYVSFLYGFSYGDYELSIDVNLGYMKGQYLFDLIDTKLGEYHGSFDELRNLFFSSPYYTINYVKDGNDYKFYSIELKY